MICQTANMKIRILINMTLRQTWVPLESPHNCFQGHDFCKGLYTHNKKLNVNCSVIYTDFNYIFEQFPCTWARIRHKLRRHHIDMYIQVIYVVAIWNTLWAVRYWFRDQSMPDYSPLQVAAIIPNSNKISRQKTNLLSPFGKPFAIKIYIPKSHPFHNSTWT